MYGGKMVLRFDDTNPMNEKIEFEENIKKDLQTLKINPDLTTYTSDYFDVLKDYMEQLIKLGLAYADNTPSEEMKAQRDEGIESKYRTATLEENLQRFQLMLEGKKEVTKPVEEKKVEKKEGGGKRDDRKKEEKKIEQAAAP